MRNGCDLNMCDFRKHLTGQNCYNWPYAMCHLLECFKLGGKREGEGHHHELITPAAAPLITSSHAALALTQLHSTLFHYFYC